MKAMAKGRDMKMPPVYLASVESEKEGGYTVSFPDLEGCFTQGETFEDAVRYAAEAAAQWLEARGSYPEPGDPRKVTKAILRAGGIPAAIEAPALKAKVVPVTISLSEPVLRRIDMAAEVQGLTRSAFISFASMQAAGAPPELIASHTAKGRKAKSREPA
jgi:predicted RNase H-like HicB family nuclease